MAANRYRQSTEAVLADLEVTEQGLSAPEVVRRQERYGRNELVERPGKHPWAIFWEQLSSTLVLVLIVAAIASILLRDFKDAAAILAIVILNAALGFRQEYRAERAMEALKKLAVPRVRVRRAGQIMEIDAPELVPGDIVLLEAGNLVPADGRLLSAVNLQIEEAALTGESLPVDKIAERRFSRDVPLAERANMAYMGTVVSYGHGEVLVTATGMESELGHIANLLQAVESEPTPLQLRLDQLGRWLALIALVIVVVIFGLGWLRGEDLHLMFLTAVSMAVAAVPEGLPAVVTIALAIGAQRMLKRNALIRKLPAVETLGSVTVICSDKTGTLTENQMTVTVLDVAGRRLDLEEELHRSRTGTLSFPHTDSQSADPALSLLLTGGALCNDAHLVVEEQHPAAFRIIGDPTEGALAVVAARLGLRKEELEARLPRVMEAPFDSDRKRMTTVHRLPDSEAALPQELAAIRVVDDGDVHNSFLAFTKGAADSLLDVTDRVWAADATEPLSTTGRAAITAAHDGLAAQGMRVLGVAMRPWQTLPAANSASDLEQGLIFVGLIAMIDPPRPQVRAAVQICRSAGIRPMMITGDHPLTARHIARQLDMGIQGGLLTGNQLDRLSPKEFGRAVEMTSVYARVSPEHKLRIVQALQQRGHVVAMTGDGVNDAPALKKAEIGVAMGITGTDVAKEASEMILRDDNFATIVAAVEEGRTIYDNVRKFIKYLLSCNSGELWVMLLAPFLGMPLPLLPLQILWMNLVTDGLPALALGVEPAEHDLMERAPHPPTESVFSRGLGRDVIWVGLVMGLAPLLLGLFYWQNDLPGWQTMVFTTLTLGQMALALTVRSERDSLFHIGILSNRAMLGAVTMTFLLQLAVIYLPFFQNTFDTVALTGQDLGIACLLATIPFWALELEKWAQRLLAHTRDGDALQPTAQGR